VRSLSADKHIIDYYEAGRDSDRHQVVFHGTREEALSTERQLRKKLRKDAPHGPHTCDDIATGYLEDVELHQSPKTLKDKRLMLWGHLLPFFGRLLPDTITDNLITAYKQRRKETTGRKTFNRAVNLELLCLSAMLKWGAEHNLCSAPDRFKPLPYRRSLPDTVSRSDVASLLDAMTGKTRAMFATIYYCGMRFQEATRLRPENLSQDKSFFVFRGKGGRERRVPVPDDLRPLLETLDLSGDWLFPSRVRNPETGRHEPLTDIRAPLKHAAERAGIGGGDSSHLLHHSFDPPLL